MVDKAISEKSNLTFNLSYLIQLMSAIAIFTYAYVTITGQISTLENQVFAMKQDIKDHTQWQREWENGGVLPLDVKQNEKINHLEKEVSRLHKEIYGID